VRVEMASVSYGRDERAAGALAGGVSVDALAPRLAPSSVGRGARMALSCAFDRGPSSVAFVGPVGRVSGVLGVATWPSVLE